MLLRAYILARHLAASCQAKTPPLTPLYPPRPSGRSRRLRMHHGAAHLLMQDPRPLHDAAAERGPGAGRGRRYDRGDGLLPRVRGSLRGDARAQRRRERHDAIRAAGWADLAARREPPERVGQADWEKQDPACYLDHDAAAGVLAGRGNGAALRARLVAMGMGYHLCRLQLVGVMASPV
jgi:hypothetical protein